MEGGHERQPWLARLGADDEVSTTGEERKEIVSPALQEEFVVAARNIERVRLFQEFGPEFVKRRKRGLKTGTFDTFLDPGGMPLRGHMRALQVGEAIVRRALNAEFTVEPGIEGLKERQFPGVHSRPGISSQSACPCRLTTRTPPPFR